ncbi:MAG: hypothetical protein KUG79_04830 [Pseudomonadales bacterium]|nr:hypothetical protein [Pseudomonadales bacterium]
MDNSYRSKKTSRIKNAQPLTVRLLFVISLLITNAASVSAAEWSTTEIHYQQGDLDNAFTAGDTKTTIFTLQHASGWQYGSNFFFIDQISTSANDDFYGELYSTFSLSRITGKAVRAGALQDIGIVLGVNVSGDANVKKYLPGLSLSWKVPGFNFVDLLITAYIDASRGDRAPKEDNSFMIDLAWNYPFSIRTHKFGITGHIEYIHQRDNQFGSKVNSWILAQPQLRYDLGYALFDTADILFIGIEYQLWRNKLGNPETDENAAQALVVWRL